MKMTHHCRRWIAAFGGILFAQSSLLAQQNVGFVEDFALAEDRKEALKLLIPGTEDYYYFHALHFQNERDLKELNRILVEWKNRFQNSSARKKIENREALLKYSNDPQATLDYLKKELDLQLSHQQEGKAREANHPSVLDPAQVSWETFLKDALGRSSALQNLNQSGFFEFLESKPKLTVTERRDLLSRATTPDLPGLVEIILDDLKTKESKGFGEFAIHRALTKLQLEQLLAARKELINVKNFVETYLIRLLPGADVNLASSPEVREAYLERASKFIATLPASFNSLKVHILYQRLVHDRAQGKENEKRFLAYLALPRKVSYLNPKWRESEPAAWRYPAELGRDFSGITTLPPARGGDEELVKSYLLKFLKDDRSSSEFAPYLRDTWLRRVFAEAKITHGMGKPSDWASLLSPSEFQALKDRVDIEFDSTSQEIYQLNDEVSLKMHLKNVPKLIVKVFEINTLNYYRSLGGEVSTDIDLDGLVANFREVHEYDEAPQLRVAREFKIPAIPNRRGLWVVEFIGAGKSSRAVVRKGALGILNKTTTVGELVTVLDEKNQPLKNAALWLGRKQYQCDKDGQTILPFSNNPGIRSIVIQDPNGFATIAKLVQPAEKFELNAGMYLDQESLRTGGKAKLIVRPTLTVAGQTISLGRIESASLELSSANLDNLPASMSVSNLKLTSDRELTHEFRVPDRLTNLTATLRVKVKIASQGGKEVELTSSRSFKVNETLRSNRVGDLFLSKINDRYRVEFFGRNGEPLAGHNLNVTLHHRHFTNQRSVTLKTTARGSIDLGLLADLSQISVSTPEGTSRQWNLKNDRRDQSDRITLVADQDLKVPFVGSMNRKELAFFSYENGGFLADEFSRLKLVKGYLTAKLPAGDYRLFLKGEGRTLEVLVGGGEVSQGYVFGEARMLELPVRQPSHLHQVKANAKTLEIEVAGADPLTRIHVMGTRFLPGNDPFLAMGGSQRAGLRTGRARHLPSLYISGRNLGDELRYILERRYADKFPGNMLTRPELLLNPWAVRDTSSGEEVLKAGDKFSRKPTAPAAPAMLRKSSSARGGKKKTEIGSHSYEFLARGSVLIANLVPDKNGKVSINLDAFGDRQHIHVLLVDPEGATYRSVSLPDRKTGIRDLRLMGNALDPKRHFTEQEQVSILKKGDTLKIPDLLNSQFEVYDHLGSVYRYFLTLKNDPTLREFSFITKWSEMKDDEKRAKYSEFACHELSFFLSRKDPGFFKEVVLPHLANKKDQTFMDDYLLGRPLGKYLEAYHYARLNVVERILLSQKDGKRLAALSLDLRNRLALRKPDLDQASLWFRTAVSGGAFGTGYAGKTLEVADGIVMDEKKANRSLSLGALFSAGQNLSVGGAKDRAKKMVSRQLEELADLEEEVAEARAGAPVDAFFDGDADLAERVSQLYRALDPTKEWAENNYYHLRPNEHNYSLIDENRFWLDLASHGLKPGFGSRHLGEVTGNFAEMMLALAFLDLPFAAPEHKDKIEKGTLDFTAGGNALFFHREVREAGMAAKRPPLLVSQSYFQLNDRFRMENGRKVDKFITDEFVRGVVYGAQVVVTNPTSSSQRLDILTQLPKGAIAVLGQRSTSTKPVELQPYATQRLEIAFYFPASGDYPVYPAHLSRAGEVVAHADTLIFKVVDEPTTVDQTSWDWMSQWGEEDVVLKYLETGNLHAVELTKIAWRCRGSADFFGKALVILKMRGIYHATLQGYAVAHNDKDAIGQLLLMQEGFLDQCGVALDCELVTVDPINRRRYEHLEYKPLINNRAHALGGENRILNPVIRGQYLNFLHSLSQRKSLDEIDRLSVTYYLFLQDRVSEALAHLKQVKPGQLDTRMQYDYFQAYSAFYQEDLAKAKQLAAKYEKYAVDRWRDRFADLSAQIKEIEGAAPEVIEEGNREQEQQLAASREPTLDLGVKGVKATLDYQNVTEVTVNYYEMDLEFLFSTNPFVSSGTSRFAIIQPNQSTTMKLAKGKGVKTFDLPERYRASNVIIEILGGGKKASKAVYANELKASVSETMGMLTVRHSKTGKPLSKVYVKVYADTENGIKFFKDGYTDLRGKFDYASVSTSNLGKVRNFSILVMSEESGATVLEASVPQR